MYNHMPNGHAEWNSESRGPESGVSGSDINKAQCPVCKKSHVNMEDRAGENVCDAAGQNRKAETKRQDPQSIMARATYADGGKKDHQAECQDGNCTRRDSSRMAQ